MAKRDRATFTVEPGRVILKDGEIFLMVAVPSAFFAGPSATQEEADKITARIAELLTEHGE